MTDEITDVKPPKGFPHIRDLTGSEATILQLANEQGDILGYATMEDIDAYIEKKVSETIHSFTQKQTFQDVTINGTFDGDSVVNVDKLNGALTNYVHFGNTLANVDLNDVKQAGFYVGNWANGCTNIPKGYDTLFEFSLEVIDGGIYPKQVFRGRNNFVAQRTLDNNEILGTHWTDWVQVETKKLILSGNTGQSTYYNYSFDSLDNGLYEVDYHFGSLLTQLSGIVVFAKLNEYSGASSEPQIIIATNGRTVNKTQIISNTWNDGVTLFKIR